MKICLKKADPCMTKYYTLSIHQVNTHFFKTLIQRDVHYYSKKCSTQLDAWYKKVNSWWGNPINSKFNKGFIIGKTQKKTMLGRQGG